MYSFQDIIFKINHYWCNHCCALMQPYDIEIGAATSHRSTFFHAIGPEPWRAAYLQPTRRPKDGRYGENPNRLQQYYQYQVVLKPPPTEIINLYIDSLIALKINPKEHDIRFVEDNWENPTLGSWGLGWEVWLDGMEISQFTYFQQVGGLDCKPITGEITYGLERLAMHLQNVDSVFDLIWSKDINEKPIFYRDIFLQNEIEQSAYNFIHANPDLLFDRFNDYESEATRLIGIPLIIPAYESTLKAAHTFNILDARGVISRTERTSYIGRIRDLSRLIALAYYSYRKNLNFPMLHL
ncbi:MAG: glycine--tRNA ligase subunit alpha [Bordetella sp.]|nr:MAG: glycine--tRNA ligase subunit alpha [Bordetella sp.]